MQQIVKKDITVGQTVNATFTGQTGRNVANYQITDSGDENVSYELSLSNDTLTIAVTGLSATAAPLYDGDTPQYSETLHVVYLGDVPGQADEPIGDVWYNVAAANAGLKLSLKAGSATPSTFEIMPYYAGMGAESVEGWKFIEGDTLDGTDITDTIDATLSTGAVKVSGSAKGENLVPATQRMYYGYIWAPYSDDDEHFIKVAPFVLSAYSTDKTCSHTPLVIGTDGTITATGYDPETDTEFTASPNGDAATYASIALSQNETTGDLTITLTPIAATESEQQYIIRCNERTSVVVAFKVNES